MIESTKFDESTFNESCLEEGGGGRNEVKANGDQNEISQVKTKDEVNQEVIIMEIENENQCSFCLLNFNTESNDLIFKKII